MFTEDMEKIDCGVEAGGCKLACWWTRLRQPCLLIPHGWVGGFEVCSGSVLLTIATVAVGSPSYQHGERDEGQKRSWQPLWRVEGIVDVSCEDKC